MSTAIYSILIFFLIFQIFLTYAGLSFLVGLFTKGKVQIRASTGIFFIPFLYFYARNLHIVARGDRKMDSANIKIKSIRFGVSFHKLLQGKIEIYSLVINELEGLYTARIPSKEKIKWLPPKEKIWIKNGCMWESDLLIKDRTRFPAYTIHLKEIQLDGVNMDMGYPGHLLFHTKKGSCNIGSGKVQTELFFPHHGFIKVSGVTWAEFMNMESLPIQLLKGSVELHAEYTHKENSMDIRGVMGRRAKDRSNTPADEKERFGFNFTINWDDYKLPIDLVLRKLIMIIFSGTLVDGVVNSTISIVRDSIFSFLKAATPKPKPPKEIVIEKEEIPIELEVPKETEQEPEPE